MLKKLRIKFVCINMTLVTAMLVFILFMVVNFTKAGMEQTSIQRMNQLASNPLYLIRPTDNMNIQFPHFSLRLNQSGNLVETYNRYYDLSKKGYLEDILDSTSEIDGTTGVIEEHNLRFMRVSTPDDEFLIFADISNEISTIEDLTRTCVIIGIVSFFIFLVISIFLSNWAVRPVEKAWIQQKQFIADASHELKTPLTVILTNAELLQDSCYNADQKTMFSRNILAVSTQMKNLVEKLLELSRLDNNTVKKVVENVNFSQLTETSVCLFEPLFYESGLELISEIEDNIHVSGNPDQLKEVIDILLDNAMKYSFPHTEIYLDLRIVERTADKLKNKFYKPSRYCQLTVLNHGNRIPAEDLENIFKRFYRTDSSRTSSESYGLGLAIAERIVTEHCGKIWAESNEEFNTFYVQLPLTST